MNDPEGSPVPTKLHQINAVLLHAKTTAQRDLTDLHHTVQKVPLLSGLSRTYQPRDEDGEQLPPEGTRVQVEVGKAIAEASAALGRLFDLQLIQDRGNAVAKANIVVGGKILLSDVPVTYLLFLAKRLIDLRTLVDKLPVLDPAESWSWDEAREVWRTALSQTVRSKKVPRNHVLAEATDRHPAQVQVYNEDVPVGIWTTVKLSGAVPAARRRELLARIDALIDAVQTAREEANSVEVSDTAAAGSTILDYLFRT